MSSNNIIAKNLRLFLNENQILTDDVKSILLKRIPFLKEYKVFKHPRDENRLEAQRVVYNENVRTMMGDEVLIFPQYNVSSNIFYYPHTVGDNTFHHFIIKNGFHVTKPEGMDDLLFRVFIIAKKQLETNLSYSKEIMVKNGEQLSKYELDKIINEMNGVLFKIEEYTKKHHINLF